MPLLEFTVLGPPVSHQCKNPATLSAWRAKVLAEATKAWGGKPLLNGKLQCTIMNFHEGHKPPCDDDNMVKPIRDIMNKVVYEDDQQITHSYTVQISINDPVQIRKTAMLILMGYAVGDEFLYVRIDEPQTISNYRSNPMNEQEILAGVAKRYSDDGYDVVIRPTRDAAPEFAADFTLDLIAKRQGDNVIVEVKKNRAALEHDPNVARLASIVNSQPAWRFDLVLLQPETTAEKVVDKGAEPSEEEILQMLSHTQELAQAGHLPSAYVFVWGALEAAMRHVRSEFELYGRLTPNELMRTLYSNGLLSDDEFRTLRESFALRTQLVHGMKVDPNSFSVAPVERIAAIARKVLTGDEYATALNG